MLNSLAAFVIVGLVNDIFKITGPTFARTADVGNAAMPILFGRNGNLGIFITLVLVALTWVLIYRTPLGFEIRTVGANPSAARYAGMSPRRLIVLTMSLCGMFAGLAGAFEILSLGYYPAIFGTTIGFAGITVALLGRAHPVGILLAALLLGGMRAGAPAMQITAKIPIEIIDVIQGLILLFLAAEPVIRHLLRSRDRAGHAGLSSARSRGRTGRRRSDGRPVRHPGPRLRLPVPRLPRRRDLHDEPAGPDPPARDADRARRAVRGDERAERHRQHRHRGDDADRAPSSASWPASSSARRCPAAEAGDLRVHAGALRRRPRRDRRRDARVAPPRVAVDHASGPTRSSAAR